MKKILFVVAALCVAASAMAQVKLPPIGTDPNLKDYTTTDSGFWIAAQAHGWYTCFINDKCVPSAEIDVTAGYRFSQYLKVGLGVGARHYFNNSDLRAKSSAWSVPVFANVRGNMINETYRDVTPYWSCDLGGSVLDGFMWRPGVGIRVGSQRSAFLLGVNYMGQVLKYRSGNERYTSAIGLTLGYEY